MCRVCGSDKDTRECCPMSRPMSTEAFMRHVFPGGHSDPSGDRATYVPACTVRDFYMERYNGWTNRETWCVILWISNDEGALSYWQDAIDKTDTEGMSAEEAEEARQDDINELAIMLREQFEQDAPELPGVWGDLYGDPLREVDWDEIAAAILED